MLGPTLVSTLAGSIELQAAIARAIPEGPDPDTETTKRLTCAGAAWRAIATLDGDDVARGWFIGGNPRLGNDTPITAIREGRFGEVTAAVKAYLDDSFGG